MNFEFDIKNKIIILCLEGAKEIDNGNFKLADNIFLEAWEKADDDFEKFIAAYYLGKYQKDNLKKIEWLNTSINYALKSNNDVIKSSLPTLYFNIGKCYAKIKDIENSEKSYQKAKFYKFDILDNGPFYHGTRADLKIGDLLTAGHFSNYHSDIVMNHIYFTAQKDGAGLAAALAQGDNEQRVYIVEPIGKFENDPNVTDMKFPGNLTRSYRSKEPLKIIGEVKEWKRLTDAEIKIWKDKLAKSNGKIIN